MIKGVIWIIIILVVVGGFFAFRGGDDSGDTELNVPAGDSDVADTIVATDGGDNTSGEEENTGPQTQIVRMTASGFEPKTTTIKQGDTVEFVNGGATRWPASAFHPTHTVYPGSSISKCGGSEASSIFDACAMVESYSFTFNEVGSWNYHDHRSAARVGTIVVE